MDQTQAVPDLPSFSRIKRFLLLALAGIVLVFGGAGWMALRALEGGVGGPSTGMADGLVPYGRLWWREKAAEFGGFSGLAVDGDGAAFWAVSDRAGLVRAQMLRDSVGRLSDIRLDTLTRLTNRKGGAHAPFGADSEGMAPAQGGGFFISWEGLVRVTVHAPEGGAGPWAEWRLHEWDKFRPIFGNAGFEALAILPSGALWTFPERRSAALDEVTAGLPGPDQGQGVPVLQLTPPAMPAEGQAPAFGAWAIAGWLPEDGRWSVTGADIGPDGALWLLERKFGWRGFSTRIRRFPRGADGLPDLSRGKPVLETRPGELGNMEGISVWRAPDGAALLVTLIADNDFWRLRRTLIAEYLWP